MIRVPALLTLVVAVLLPQQVQAEDVQITPDVVYGHKFGLALTFDVFTPATDANGAGVLFMVSGGWYSGWAPPEQAASRFKPLTDAGFTVFAVRHGSSPKFGIPEAVSDVRRSVRYIRLNAEQFGIDPQRIGVYGGSAGGHLSLVLGTASDDGDPKAKDPVLRVSDRVNAVVAYVAPTDLQIMVHAAPNHLPAYDRYPALNLSLAEAKTYSPLEHVSSDDPPTLLVVGQKDDLVPYEHSKNIHAAFEKQNVTSELIVFEDAGHGFQGEDAERASMELVKWFQQSLAGKS
ncbi:MAG: alpha/beta hydrolase [Planctomycetaceae bacterium]|jgi:acetyl esterase/lipase